ncbi:hypothetical protein HDU98_001987, partial [Podochytrium sp. JEL0797]
MLDFDACYLEFIDMIRHEISLTYVNIKSLENEKIEAQALIELGNVKTSFFMSMSHELRTPLTLIIGPVDDCLQQKNLSDQQKTSLEMVRKNSTRLLRLVNTLLDIGRLNAGCMKAKFKLTNIAERTREYLSMFQSAIERSGLQFVVCCESIEGECFVDGEMWQKIVFNLLGNAIKFTLKGTIKCIIQTSQDKGHFEFV